MQSESVLTEEARRTVRDLPDIFGRLDGKSILITGGTGFVGTWLLRALAAAQSELGTSHRVWVLSRNPDSFRRRNPSLARSIRLISGDVREPFALDGPLDLIIHAASETNVAMTDPAPVEYLDIAARSALHIRDLARAAGTARIVFISSGAVYGSGAFSEGGAAEDSPPAPASTDPRAAYGNAKRFSEAFFCSLAASGGPECVIARLFAFAGPGLPLDSGFAIGNFIRDGLRGGPIDVNGDGTPERSYLYASDMALWIWTIAALGASGAAYNVGSEHAISIAALANEVASVCGSAEVRIARRPENGVRPSRYVPSTKRARETLGLTESVTLREAIERMVAFHRLEAVR